MRAKEIIDYCRILVGDPSGNIQTDEKMLLHLNTVCRDISVRSRSLVTGLYLPAAPGQARYGLPNDFLRMDLCAWLDESGQYRPLSPIQMSLASWITHNSLKGTPRHYNIFGKAAIERVIDKVKETNVLSRTVERAQLRVFRDQVNDNEEEVNLRALTTVSFRRAQEIYKRFKDTLSNVVVFNILPVILRALKRDDIQNLLNSESIPVLFLQYPDSLVNVFNHIGIDLPSTNFIEVLENNEEVRTMFADPQFQQLLQDPKAIDILVALMGYVPLQAKVWYCKPTDAPVKDYQLTIDTVMKEAQEFFAAQMDHNGYGRQTFDLDINTEGYVEVHEHILDNNIAGYDTTEEIRDVLDIELLKLASQPENSGLGTFNIFFVDIVGTAERTCGTMVAIPTVRIGMLFNNCWIWRTTAHEIGHILGLDHPIDPETGRVERNEYIMSYGGDLRDKLLPRNAALLNLWNSFQTARFSDIVVVGDEQPDIQRETTEPEPILTRITEADLLTLFNKYKSTFLRPELLLAGVVHALKQPSSQELLQSEEAINIVVDNPDLLRSFIPDIQDSVIELLKTDADLRALVRDPLTHKALKDPAALDKLEGWILDPTTVPSSVEAPAAPEAPTPIVNPPKPTTVAPPPLDIAEQWIKLESGQIVEVKRGDRIFNVSDGSSVATIIEARNVLNSATNEVEQIIIHSELENGTRSFFQAGDEIRILSPGSPLQSLILAPVPDKVGGLGDEALFMYIAKIHREITERDIHEENDFIELDPEFEPALREYMIYYMRRDELNAADPEAQTALITATTLYNEALPNVLNRIREWRNMWNKRQGYVQRPLYYTRDPVAYFPVGANYPSR